MDAFNSKKKKKKEVSPVQHAFYFFNVEFKNYFPQVTKKILQSTDYINKFNYVLT